jgi:hypothetical protein
MQVSAAALQYLSEKVALCVECHPANPLAYRFDVDTEPRPQQQELWNAKLIKMAGTRGAGWFLTEYGYNIGR